MSPRCLCGHDGGDHISIVGCSLCTCCVFIDAGDARIVARDDRIRELEAAIEPFARLSLNGDSDHDCPNNCTDTEILAARAALSTKEPSE